jgi:inner membrane protein
VTGRTHAIIGANVIWLTKIFGFPPDPVIAAVGAFAALLPDLDASESMIKNMEVTIGSGRNHVGIKPFAIPALLLSTMFRHRGWLHSGVAVVVVGVVSWLAFARSGLVYPLAITAGYASHLLADACTKSGIQFMLPIHRSVHIMPKPLRFRAGGFIDTGLLIIAALTLSLAFLRT